MAANTLPTVGDQHEQWVSIDDLAARFHCSRSTIYRMIREGDLPPARKFGRAARLPLKASLDRVADLPVVRYAPKAA